MLEYLFTKTPLLFLVQDLWRDEAFSFVLAAKSLPEILKLTAGDFNPPLYYILLHFWMMIFGSSEIALRSLSLIFFMGTIYILYDACLYALKIPHKRTIVYFSLFFFNPFLLTYAFEARMYIMVTFFVTLSYFSLWTGRKKLYVLSIALGLYTHYLSIFIFIAQALSELFALWLKNRKKNPVTTLLLNLKTKILSPAKTELHSITFQFLTPALIFLPWALYMISRHNFSDGAFWIITPPVSDIFYLPFVLYTGYERIFGEYYHERAGYTNFHVLVNWILYMILISPLYIYIINGTQKSENLKRQTIAAIKNLWNDRVIRDVLLWTFFPPFTIFLLSFVTSSLYLPRYFIFSSTGFLLLIVICFENILGQDKKKIAYPLVLVGILGIFLLMFTKTYNILNLKYHSKRNIKSIYKEVQALKNDRDLIYLDSELDYHLAQYYFGLKEKIYIYNKTYDGIPQYVGKVLIPPDAVTQVLPSYPIRAFVIYYHWYNIRSLN